MNHLIVIVGPTAVGKTRAAIALANHFDTEVISADSRQFYKEMTIGTAKPSPKERAAAKHHFIDFLPVTDKFNAGDFEREALAKLDAIFEKSSVAIVTGGSGLYVNALCYGFDDIPEVPVEIRDRLNSEFEEKGLVHLQEKLRMADPVYFDTVDRNNPQRLIRALEVYEHTNSPYSQFRKKELSDRNFMPIFIGLELPREELYERINQRVDNMIDEGLIEEVKSLLPFKEENALQTVGYQELFDYLDNKITLSEAIDLIKRNTRRYAKRQLTWFRRNENTFWYHPDDISSIINDINLRLK
ncbi:MAG: tRNA (adenosine(37)-N6)-dimethylallyltransferase MiaA [Candidatus Cyclobacteriaceae bacterium M2_1C_046]